MCTICMHNAHTLTCTNTHNMHTQVYANMQVHTHTHAHTHTLPYTHTHTHTHTCTHTHVHTHAHTHIRTHTHTHTRTHTHTLHIYYSPPSPTLTFILQQLYRRLPNVDIVACKLPHNVPKNRYKDVFACMFCEHDIAHRCYLYMCIHGGACYVHK